MDSELPWEAKVPDPFEALWVSADAGELDKIAKQEDQGIDDLGCHINPGLNLGLSKDASTAASETVEKAVGLSIRSRRMSG